MDIKHLVREIENKIVGGISSELKDAGLEAEVELNPAMKGCIATLSTGEELFIPVSVRLERTGSYSIEYQIPELTFLPEYEVFRGEKKHKVRASDTYHAALIVLKKEGSKAPEEEAKRLANHVSLVSAEDDDELIVVEEEPEYKEENYLAEMIARSNGMLRESIAKVEDSQIVMRIIQNEFDQADVPVVVSSVELEGDTGTYHVESMISDIDYEASLPVKVEKKNNIVHKVSCLIKPVKRVFGTRIFEMKLPDGNIVTVETTSEEKAVKAVEDYWVGTHHERRSSEPKFEIVSEKEIDEHDFNPDILLNPWATIYDINDKYLVEID